MVISYNETKSQTPAFYTKCAVYASKYVTKCYLSEIVKKESWGSIFLYNVSVNDNLYISYIDID